MGSSFLTSTDRELLETINKIDKDKHERVGEGTLCLAKNLGVKKSRTITKRKQVLKKRFKEAIKEGGSLNDFVYVYNKTRWAPELHKKLFSEQNLLRINEQIRAYINQVMVDYSTDRQLALNMSELISRVNDSLKRREQLAKR